MKKLENFTELYEYTIHEGIDAWEANRVIRELVYALESHDRINLEQTMNEINDILGFDEEE